MRKFHPSNTPVKGSALSYGAQSAQLFENLSCYQCLGFYWLAYLIHKEVAKL